MPYKILIVDDEPANLRTLARLFRDEYEVFTAGSGDEALALLGQHDVALLITDQRMPGMTGIELLKKTVPLRPAWCASFSLVTRMSTPWSKPSIAARFTGM